MPLHSFGEAALRKKYSWLKVPKYLKVETARKLHPNTKQTNKEQTNKEQNAERKSTPAEHRRREPSQISTAGTRCSGGRGGGWDQHCPCRGWGGQSSGGASRRDRQVEEADPDSQETDDQDGGQGCQQASGYGGRTTRVRKADRGAQDLINLDGEGIWRRNEEASAGGEGIWRRKEEEQQDGGDARQDDWISSEGERGNGQATTLSCYDVQYCSRNRLQYEGHTVARGLGGCSQRCIIWWHRRYCSARSGQSETAEDGSEKVLWRKRPGGR